MLGDYEDAHHQGQHAIITVVMMMTLTIVMRLAMMIVMIMTINIDYNDHDYGGGSGGDYDDGYVAHHSNCTRLRIKHRYT